MQKKDKKAGLLLPLQVAYHYFQLATLGGIGQKHANQPLRISVTYKSLPNTNVKTCLFSNINQKDINSKVLFKELAPVLPSFFVPSQIRAVDGWVPVHL